MKTHPVAALFPLVEGAEFEQLAADIRDHGQREAIKTWNGVLLDGRNRLRACEAAGVTPRFEAMEFASEYDAICYIISINIHRRHLDAGQRAMMGEALRPHFEMAAKRRQEAGQEQGRESQAATRRGKTKVDGPEIGANADRSGRVDHALAKMLNVSHSTMAQAHKVATAAPELADKVRAGEVKLNAAYKEVRPSKPSARRANGEPHRDPSVTPAKGRALASAVLDGGKTVQQAANEFAGGSVQTAKIEIARERGRRDPQIDVDTLPKSAKEKLDAAIRQEKLKLESEFEKRVQAEIKRLVDEMVLPQYRKEMDDARDVIKARKGVMPREEYRLILSCLHPDQSASPDRIRKAFDLFQKRELVLCSEKEMPTTAPTAMPRSYDEMMRRQAEAKSKTKGAASTLKRL